MSTQIATQIHFVLDRSGSMWEVLMDTIGGFNTLLYTLSNTGVIITINDRNPDNVLKIVEKYDVELLEILKKHFECSKLEVKEYLDLIDKDELLEILSMYGSDKKTIKRLCK